MASGVSLSGLTRAFTGASAPAVAALTLEVGAGEVLALVGPSGCGKSTTLRLVAGLERADAGRISIGERDVTELAPQDRDVAMVFQGFALYPHMSVREILAFPLKMRGVPRASRTAQVERTASLLGLGALLDRRPAELSGGEQQRVAMGRAIVREPAVFLFDEPLSNLDAALRARLRSELGALLGKLGTTAIYVTHDQVEAMTLGHRIAVLVEGRLEQCDTPRAIYESPKSTFVAGFFGSPPMNLLDAERTGAGARAGKTELPTPPPAAPTELVVGIRPEHLKLIEPDSSHAHRVAGTVAAVEPLGAETHVIFESDGRALQARVQGFFREALGAPLTFGFEPRDLRWFRRSDGKAIE